MSLLNVDQVLEMVNNPSVTVTEMTQRVTAKQACAYVTLGAKVLTKLQGEALENFLWAAMQVSRRGVGSVTSVLRTDASGGQDGNGPSVVLRKVHTRKRSLRPMGFEKALLCCTVRRNVRNNKKNQSKPHDCTPNTTTVAV